MPLLVHVVSWWLLGLAVGGMQKPEVFESGRSADAIAPSARMTMAVVLLAAWLVFAWRVLVPGARAPRVGTPRIRARHMPSGVWIAPVFAIGGWLVSSAARQEQTSCRALVVANAQRGQLPWLLVDDVTAGAGSRGALVRGEVRESESRSRCRVHATVRWFGTPPTPGSLVQTPGLVTSTARGIRVEQRATLSDSIITASTTVDRLRAWRGHLGTVIDERFRSRAPLVRALLIADQDGLDHALRERYADAGLVHMLSVSGMHVAIIASALLTLGGMARVPKSKLEPISLALVTLYVLLIGAPAPAVRSAVMLAVVTLAARWQRPVHEWTALALGATVPTIDPLVVHDLGYQLSVGGMAALVAARAARRQWRHWARHGGRQHGWRDWSQQAARWGGWRGWLLTEILTGVVATVITAPLIAWTFGRISVIAPISNLAAAPIVGVLQPALFVALAWAMLWSVADASGSAIAGWLPDATQPLMAMLDVVADVSARVPGAVWPVAPTLATACGMGLVCVLLVRASASRRSRSWIFTAAVVACLTVWTDALRGMGPAWLLRNGHLEMHVLDVGQGDAVALRTPRGRWVIVDAGPRWQGGDAGRRTVVPHIKRYGGDVALFVLSHAHDDHAGGAASVVDALRPLRWWESAFVGTSPGYRDALRRVATRGVRWERVRPGQHMELDGVRFTVLAPDSAWTAAQHDANETSVVLRAEFGAHRFLLTGDAEHDEESWLVNHYAPDELAADVLKVGHHGSRTSSTPAFLDAVRPRVAVVSLGTGNRYGHPATETLQAFLDRTIPVMRTDLEGVVVVRSDGRTLSVESRGERWIVPQTLLHVFHPQEIAVKAR
ncbi:MAG: DNA internalization-related competence protein ComEC/Rec2 [Gemmatimonadaceae bacterium]|nr:DNA internalization-related competence protein ComEC/Rec2 [Gemmatimonadaceae bacterium]